MISLIDLATDKKTDKIKESIKKSGHNLHLATAGRLESLKWDVDVSPYYLDDITEKPREIDIVAQCEKRLVHPKTKQEFGSPFKVNLFVECKGFEKPVLFFKHRIHKSRLLDAIKSSTQSIGVDTRHYDKGHHHYLTALEEDNISKLFQTNGRDPHGGNDPVYSAITQAIKSLIFFRGKHSNTPGYYLPVVVYEGEITNVKDGKPEKCPPRTFLEVDYHFKSPTTGQLQNEIFIVEFLKISELENLDDDIRNKDVKEIINQKRNNYLTKQYRSTLS